MRLRIVAWAMITACALPVGCATDGTSGARPSFMAACEQNAKTEQERSECAWKNAERMAGGN